ncbi:MAG TPA: FAD-dependent oxidoreductase [Streptosporangiaceae bacterium]|nr:FAD-dependent oxidoreductase [Streptosporangiaceae bacterium]
MNIPNLHIFTSTKLSFIHEAHLTADVYAFYFKPQKPLKHRAGQAGFLTVPGGGTKFLTLSSSPDDDLAVFATHIHPASTFKQALGRLHPGDTVKFRGPFIGATLDNKHGTPVVFLTQGIGITPHRSILCHIARSKLPVYTTLIHVDRSGHPFREETQALAMEAYFPESSDEFKRQVLEVAGKQPDAAYYVAGGLRFHASTLQLLKQRGIKSSAIHHDRLPNYMNKSVITPYHDLTDWRRKRAW